MVIPRNRENSSHAPVEVTTVRIRAAPHPNRFSDKVVMPITTKKAGIIPNKYIVTAKPATAAKIAKKGCQSTEIASGFKAAVIISLLLGWLAALIFQRR